MQETSWFMTTIILPVAVPILGLAIGRFFPLAPKFSKKTGFWSQFRDGQLGWVSVGWSIGAVYEIKHHIGRDDYLDAMEIAAFILIFLGMIVSAGGAIEAEPEVAPRKLFFVASAVIAAISAFVFYNSHIHIEGLARAAEIFRMQQCPCPDGN